MNDERKRGLLKLAKEGDSLLEEATRDEVQILVDEGLVTTRHSGLVVDTAPAELCTGKFADAETPVDMVTGLTAKGEERLQDLMQAN